MDSSYAEGSIIFALKAKMMMMMVRQEHSFVIEKDGENKTSCDIMTCSLSPLPVYVYVSFKDRKKLTEYRVVYYKLLPNSGWKNF